MTEVKIMEKILLINKPAGLTSHDVVDEVRKIFKLQRVGHSGTLDPLATGLLVLGLGKATKSLGEISKLEKEYIADLKLGVQTNTQDREGEILSQTKDFHVSKDEFVKTCEKFLGKIMQIPPMFSAKKKNGKKLYELARKGITIEREPKSIEVFHIKVLEFDGVCARLDICCSSGTYVRTLCHDIGQMLGMGALMTELVRTRIGQYFLKDALSLEELAHGINP